MCFFVRDAADAIERRGWKAQMFHSYPDESEANELTELTEGVCGGFDCVLMIVWPESWGVTFFSSSISFSSLLELSFSCDNPLCWFNL